MKIASVNVLNRGVAVILVAIVAIGAGRTSLASSHGGDHGDSHGAEAEVETQELHEATAEESAEFGSTTGGVALGEYQIRSYYPVEAQKSTVRFILCASVKNEALAPARHYVAAHRHKIRDQVITATRLAPLAVYNEADLASFRRRILVRLRRAMPELVLEDVYISDFTLIVKSL
jgi:hypothetical protein